MENNSLTKFILGFLVLIVGLALISQVAVNTNAVAGLTSTSESIDISGDRALAGVCGMSVNGSALTLANAPSTGWRSGGGCPITNFILANQTGETAVITTDYTFFAANGTVHLVNNTKFVHTNCTSGSNTTTAMYTYCPSGYMNIGWGRAILDLVAGFFGLALLLVSVAIFYSIAKDSGILAK